MTRVVIQPSYGNADAWRHWDDTLGQEVDFSGVRRRSALAVDEFAALLALHPDGTARFWGATGNHDAKMATLRRGDVILFTGKKLVRAVGEVGVAFQNAAFADTLWDPHGERGSYRNVYSLLAFQETQIPYEEVWQLPGFNEHDNFMGLRFLDEEKSATVLDGLRITPTTALRLAAAAVAASAPRLHDGRVVPPEAVRTTSTFYEVSTGVTLVERSEAVLVQAYRQWLPPTAEVGRLRTSVGLTDLLVQGGGGTELIEAKRAASHGFVREALGQLMDYVLHAPMEVDCLTALFPERPAEQDLQLLHRYGLDCLYLGAAGDFIRVPAPGAARDYMKAVWRPQEGAS